MEVFSRPLLRYSGLKKESQLFGELGMTTVSQALRGIFFSQTATKKNPYGKPPVAVSTVGVLGAGLMGAGIAQVTSGAGELHLFLRGKSSIWSALSPSALIAVVCAHSAFHCFLTFCAHISLLEPCVTRCERVYVRGMYTSRECVCSYVCMRTSERSLPCVYMKVCIPFVQACVL